jgi:hypothetical protein
LAAKHRVLDDWCTTEGRDPAQIERAGGAGDGPEKLGDELLAAGTTLVTIGLGGPRYDLSMVKDWVAWRDEKNAG